MQRIDSNTRDDSRLFDNTRGFFRVRTKSDVAAKLDAIAVAGPPLDHAKANLVTRQFVDVLTDGRPVEWDDLDTLAYAERNNLFLLFGPDDQARFERLYARMPRDLVEQWRAALRGGDPRDSFGPLTPDERLDERRIAADLRSGRRQRRMRLGIGVLLVAAAIVGAVLARRESGDDGPAPGQIAFGSSVDRNGDLRAGPPPAVEKALVARLDRPVVVRPGTGELADRIVLDVPAADLPQPVGAIAATLFRYNGAGQVVLVGPPGWLTDACIQVSVMTASLRAFDTAFTEFQPGACARDRVFGRSTVAGCVDPKAATTMIDLQIPEGEVALAEGGNGAVAAVRVTLIGKSPTYERNNLSGQIAVATGTEVKVPTFGGAVGSTVNFDVSAATGAPIVGSCTLR